MCMRLLALLLVAAVPAVTARPSGLTRREADRPRKQRSRRAPLLARDFGAIGDGKHDDTAALQQAIDAAQQTNSELVLPNGTFAVSRSLEVLTPRDPPSPIYPLSLRGSGMQQSTIVATAPMNAVLNFSTCCGAAPAPQGWVELSHFGVESAKMANFSILAPGLVRSYLTSLRIQGALIAGASIGYGWCNYIEDCEFSFNRGIGLHTYNSANNIDIIDSGFDGNGGPAIYISGGAQILIQGNSIEGNRGPGIVAFATHGLLISSNYFEANNNAMDWPGLPPMTVAPLRDVSPGAPTVTVNSDILLLGEPSFHDGNSAVGSWPAAPAWTYGSTYPNEGTTIQGGYHAPGPNASAVWVNAAKGLTLVGNTAAQIDSHTTDSSNLALLETGVDDSLFLLSRVFLQGNTGWSYAHAGAPRAGSRSNLGFLKANRAPYKAFTGGMDFHTLTVADPFEHSVPRNLASRVSPRDWPVSNNGSISAAASQYDGSDVFTLRCVGVCTATAVGALALDREPAFAGQLVYVALQARLTPSSGLSLLIDTGDGGGWRSASDSFRPASDTGQWLLFSFEATLGWAGTARFGVQLFGPKGGHLAADIGRVVIGPAGSEWTRLQ